MTDEEILKKAINKAQRNGFWDYNKLIVEDMGEDQPVILGDGRGSRYSIEEIIFSHDFAKAFWGTHRCANDTIGYQAVMIHAVNEGCLIYKYHLSNMVIYTNPIKYLEKFL